MSKPTGPERTQSILTDPVVRGIKKYLERSILPPEVQRALLSIGKLADPYESELDAAEKTQNRDVYFNTLDDIELSGVLRQLKPLIQGTIRNLSSFYFQEERKLVDRMNKMSFENPVDFEKAKKRYDDFSKDYGRSCKTFMEMAQRDHRPLLMLIAHEIVTGAAQRGLQHMIKKDGAEQVFKEQNEFLRNAPDAAPFLSHNLRWHELVYRLANSKTEKTSDGVKDQAIPLDPKLILEWLDDVDLQGVGQGKNTFDSKALNAPGFPLKGILHSPDELHPFLVAGFEITHPLLSNSIQSQKPKAVAGDISRVTGELTINGMYFTSLRNVFEYFGIPQVYDVLRTELLTEVYKLYERERIKSQAERNSLRELLSQDQQVSTPETVVAEAEVTHPAALDKQLTTPPAAEASPPPVLTERLTGEYNPEKVRQRILTGLGKMSDREFKRRIKKLPGIRITHDSNHTHIKSERTGNKILTFNTKGSQGNPVLHGAEIRNKLDLLGVSVEEFLSI